MPAALWAAWKGAGIAWKIGTIVVPIVILIGLLMAYGQHKYNKGVQVTEDKYAKAALTQAVQSQTETTLLINDRAAREKIHQVKERELQEQIDDLKRKLVDNAHMVKIPANDPPTPAPVVAVFDDIRGVLNTPSADRVPATDAASGALHELSPDQPGTTATLLGVEQGLGDLAEQCAGLQLEYQGLVQEIRGAYIVQQALYEKQQEGK